MNSAGSSSDTIGLAVDAYIRNKLPYSPILESGRRVGSQMAKASPKHLMTTMAPAKSPAARRRFCTGGVMGSCSARGCPGTRDGAEMWSAACKSAVAIDRGVGGKGAAHHGAFPVRAGHLALVELLKGIGDPHSGERRFSAVRCEEH